MKRILFVLIAVVFLCSCESEPTVPAELSNEVSEESEVACAHAFANEPIEVVGNLYVYECTLCGEHVVVPQGTLIGN